MSPAATRLHQKAFQRILTRNVALPLAVSLVGALLFVGLVLHLMSSQQWVAHSDQVIAATRKAAQTGLEMESSLRDYLNTGQDDSLAPYRQAQARWDGELAGVTELITDNPSQTIRLRRIRDMQANWVTQADQLVAMRRRGDDVTPLLAQGNTQRAREEIRTAIDNFLVVEQQLRSQRSEALNGSVLVIGGLYLFFTLGVGILLAYVGRRDLLVLSDSHGQLLDEQADRNRELEDQTWLRGGQTQLTASLVGQVGLENIGRRVLEFAAQRTGSLVGAMYVTSGDGQLRRTAAYGFSPQALASEQRFAPDESLVGEAARERRMLRLDDPPAGYLRVNSALGDGAPRTVILVPIEHEDEVRGVIELAYLQAPDPRSATLLEMIAPNVGASLNAARYRQQLQDSLNDTQQLNEELQVQQEELRTANEELEEQSRALKESQAHLENQQAELEQTNEQLSEQAETLAQQRDALDQARIDLQARAAELERASRYKSEFLANMSHELRTPLNSSLILAKLLADNAPGNLNAEQVKFAESIYAAGNDLLNLINDILDISKVEAGKLEIRPESTRLESLVDGLRSLFTPLAAQKGLAFSLQVLPGAPGTLLTDRQRVEQILKNLLSNAIKFTDKGSVSLQVSAQPGQQVAFAVRDSGVGVPADQQALIFEAFRQADGTTNRKYGGTGLGLSISRDLAALLGGTISVDSRPGEGSTFTLQLPQTLEWPGTRPAPAARGTTLAPTPAMLELALPTPAEPATPAPLAARFKDDRDQMPARSRSVLVVEDEVRFAGILYDLAHELGYRCLVGLGATEGLELARRFTPNAILLDIRLPDDSGLAVLQRLKEDPRTRHIPVHMISVEDRMEAALQLGAIGYAVKPATREQLKQVFSKLEAKLTQKLKRVLLVEDDLRQRESVARLIGDDDVEITAVATGGEALAHLHDTAFDCMVIDLQLPDMTGNELLQRMSGEQIRSFPPVIVYTGRNLTHEEESQLQRYSRSIIIKGARSPERLLDEVTLFLHKVESDLSSERRQMLRTARSRDKVFEGRLILVVDDDVRNIFALTSALEARGARVEVARNGREAVDKVTQVADIDLVLMDVMMPEMDGYEATREIRRHPKFAKLPIIAVTAKAMKDDQDLCLKAGANDYLAKPIELDRLFSLIRVWMPQMERL
ncbi:MAG: response regulator [Ramlibacter sp.]|nr:response regulator [Ramlibacter sp.]